MAPADFRQLLRAEPFTPLRIATTAGVNYDINHPDLVMVGVNSIVLGTPDKDRPDYYSGVHVISLYHVVRVEVLTPASPA